MCPAVETPQGGSTSWPVPKNGAVDFSWATGRQCAVENTGMGQRSLRQGAGGRDPGEGELRRDRTNHHNHAGSLRLRACQGTDQTPRYSEALQPAGFPPGSSHKIKVTLSQGGAIKPTLREIEVNRKRERGVVSSTYPFPSRIRKYISARSSTVGYTEFSSRRRSSYVHQRALLLYFRLGRIPSFLTCR